jgi:hypothetical protein
MPTAVRIGELSRPALLEAIRARGIRMNRAAEMLLEDRRFTPSERQELVAIESISVGELGFGDGATYAQIVTRARASGLMECPLELGPHLRLQFPDQGEVADEQPPTRHRAPPGAMTVASVPLDERDETPKGFYLRRVGGVLWLRGYWSSPDNLWSPPDVFVFRRGRVPPRRT